MDVIDYTISRGPQLEEVSFMDLGLRGNRTKSHDGSMNLLCTELICYIALVMRPLTRLSFVLCSWC